MWSRPESDEALIRRMLPGHNPDLRERNRAWSEWQSGSGKQALLSFIRYANNTDEADEDILQEALVTAYLEVEQGHYRPMEGIPFTAYVKGIARNKIREARRRRRGWVPLEDIAQLPSETLQAGESHRQPESAVERREAQQALQRGMARLPDQRRQVLERYMRGQTTAQIAAALSITEELVRQHKSRAVRSLQQHMQTLFDQASSGSIWAGTRGSRSPR